MSRRSRPNQLGDDKSIMSPGRWYALTALRLIVAVGLVVLLTRWLYATGLATWLKVLLDVVVIGGIVGGSLVIGPVSYRGYREYEAALERALNDRGSH